MAEDLKAAPPLNKIKLTYRNAFKNFYNLYEITIPTVHIHKIDKSRLVGKILIQLVIALVVAYVSYLLYKPPGPPRKRDDESSPTYGWTGITQSRDPYQPVEVSYGEIRGGGTVISESVSFVYRLVTSRNLAPGESEYVTVTVGRVSLPCERTWIERRLPRLEAPSGRSTTLPSSP